MRAQAARAATPSDGVSRCSLYQATGAAAWLDRARELANTAVAQCAGCGSGAGERRTALLLVELEAPEHAEPPLPARAAPS